MKTDPNEPRESSEGMNDLAIRYAENRIELKSINDEIKSLYEIDPTIDLSGSRTWWLDQNYAWDGWVTAVEHDEDDFEKENYLNLARLLDQRAAIRKKAGRIKHAIYFLGKKLLNSNQTK